MQIEITARERDVIMLLVLGMTKQEIADTFGIGWERVKTIMEHICLKIGFDVGAEPPEIVAQVIRLTQLKLLRVIH
jgi:DNA-binding NarL/FixJ family response regulator